MLGVTAVQFVLILGAALIFGAIGAGLMLIIRHLIRKKRHVKTAASIEERSGWQRMTRDEQLYNGR